jgi:hypothetical protein
MKKPINIDFSWGNTLYMIVYTGTWDGDVGVDYTTSLIEYKELLEYHEQNTHDFQVYEINYKKEGN